uniref:YueH-like protein n=1 Tax=Geobacillus sp. (strain WCH70) TaxID=471223 RepID=C5D7Y9_GEOSW
MKIRKAVLFDERTSINVYIYENKKEEYIVVAIPDLEWSFLIRYEEETETLKERLVSSLTKAVPKEHVEMLVNKLLYWVHEM